MAGIEHRKRFGNRDWHMPAVWDAAPHDGVHASENLSAEKSFETAGRFTRLYRSNDDHYSSVAVSM